MFNNPFIATFWINKSSRCHFPISQMFREHFEDRFWYNLPEHQTEEGHDALWPNLTQELIQIWLPSPWTAPVTRLMIRSPFGHLRRMLMPGVNVRGRLCHVNCYITHSNRAFTQQTVSQAEVLQIRWDTSDKKDAGFGLERPGTTKTWAVNHRYRTLKHRNKSRTWNRMNPGTSREKWQSSQQKSQQKSPVISPCLFEAKT